MSNKRRSDLQGPEDVPRLRGQAELGEVSPVVVCTVEEDRARQEYALSSDLAYQVQRFGVGGPVRYGDQDMHLFDLTTALRLVEESQEAWLRLPKVVRDRYSSWANVERAAESGELEQVLKAAGVTGEVPVAPAASPSDSAAVGA